MEKPNGPRLKMLRLIRDAGYVMEHIGEGGAMRYLLPSGKSVSVRGVQHAIEVGWLRGNGDGLIDGRHQTYVVNIPLE